MPLLALAGGLTGLYFLFAIVVVDQWEKVALLRFGRYRGLRGPGLFLIIPIAETLRRYVDQRVRVTTVSAESTLTRDTVPVKCGRDRLLAGVERGEIHSRSRRLYTSDHAQLADGVARIHWTASVGADDY